MSTLATRNTTSQPPEEPRGSIKALIQTASVREQLMAALPKFYTPETFTVIVRTAINKNPKLQECTPESFMVAMLTAAQMGIAPDGRNGHLIPRNRKTQDNRWITECTFQPDYKGLVGLIRRNNDDVADVYAELVYDKDEIVVTKGLNRNLIHTCDVRIDRGDLIGVYAVITYKDSTASSFEYLSRADVEKVRARSDSWKSHVKNGYDTPWLTDEGEMWKKTALKRLLKLADLSPDTSDRLSADPENIPVAQAVEIREASIPLPAPETPAERPALAETTASASAEAVTPAAEAEAEKPKAKRLAKQEPPKVVEAEVVTAAAPETPVESALVTRVKEALKAAGYSEALLVEACRRQDWGTGAKDFDPETTKISDIDEETLGSFFDDDNWENLVLAELADIAKEEGRK